MFFHSGKLHHSDVVLLIGLILSFLTIYIGFSVVSIMTDETEDYSKYSYKNICAYNVVAGETDLDIMNCLKKVFGDCNIIIYDYTIYLDGSKQAQLVDVVVSASEALNYPLIDGRYPEEKDIKDNETGYVVLGKRQLQYAYSKEDKMLFDVNGESYEVIGTIQSPTSAILDYKVIIYGARPQLLSALKITMDTYGIDVLCASNKHLIYPPDTVDDILVSQSDYTPFLITTQDYSTINYSVILFIFNIVICIMLVWYWIWEQRRNLLILKIYGYSSGQLVIYLLARLVVKFIIACVISGGVIVLFGRNADVLSTAHADIIFWLKMVTLSFLLIVPLVVIYPIFYALKRIKL